MKNKMLVMLLVIVMIAGMTPVAMAALRAEPIPDEIAVDEGAFDQAPAPEHKAEDGEEAPRDPENIELDFTGGEIPDQVAEDTTNLDAEPEVEVEVEAESVFEVEEEAFNQDFTDDMAQDATENTTEDTTTPEPEEEVALPDTTDQVEQEIPEDIVEAEVSDTRVDKRFYSWCNIGLSKCRWCFFLCGMQPNDTTCQLNLQKISLLKGVIRYV